MSLLVIDNMLVIDDFYLTCDIHSNHNNVVHTAAGPNTRYILQDSNFKLVYTAGESLELFNTKSGSSKSRRSVTNNNASNHIQHLVQHLVLTPVDATESKNLLKKNCKVS